MTAIKRLIIKPVKKLGSPVLSFKRTQEDSRHNRKMLDVFNVSLGAEMESQKGISLDYGSEFLDINRIKNLFSHHEDKDIIANIIQKVLRYHLSPIEEAASKSYLEANLLRGGHKSSRSSLNAAALEKAIYKEVEHIWALPLTIESIRRIKNAGVVPLGVSEQLSINEKG